MKKSFEYNIDELYKDAFQNAQTSFDKEGMWQNVGAAVAPDRTKPVLFWLSLFTTLLLIAYFLFTLSAQTEVSKIVASFHNVTTETEANLANTQNAAGENVQKQTPPSSQKVLPIANIESEKSGQSEKALKEEQPTKKKSSSKNTSTVSDKDASSTVSNKPLKHQENTPVTPSMEDNKLNSLSLLKPVSVSLFDQEYALHTPDPNWSHCNVRKRPRFFSEFYAFGGFPLINNSLNSDPSIDYTGFLNSWDEGEKAVGSYAFGMMFGIGSHWGGTVSVGLEYQKIVNKIVRKQTVIERVTIYDDMAYYYLDSNNNRVWVGDSVTATKIYTREVQAAKTHTLVNAPILLGYYFELERWRFGLSAGINLHLFHHFSGKVLDPSGQIIDAETGSNTAVYDKQMDFSIIGGVEIGYLITDFTELYFSPRFRYNPKSWLNPAHPIESKIQIPGMKAGIRWHF